ncbi:hypothetical protein NU195Hw_g4103t1 [Hortaea werneckii]
MPPTLRGGAKRNIDAVTTTRSPTLAKKPKITQGSPMKEKKCTGILLIQPGKHHEHNTRAAQCSEETYPPHLPRRSMEPLLVRKLFQFRTQFARGRSEP